jgi:hypothetical protein
MPDFMFGAGLGAGLAVAATMDVLRCAVQTLDYLGGWGAKSSFGLMAGGAAIWKSPSLKASAVGERDGCRGPSTTRSDSLRESLCFA